VDVEFLVAVAMAMAEMMYYSEQKGKNFAVFE